MPDFAFELISKAVILFIFNGGNYNWSQNNAFASWMLLLAKDTFVTPKLLEYFDSAIKFRSMAIILDGVRKAIFRLRIVL